MTDESKLRAEPWVYKTCESCGFRFKGITATFSKNPPETKQDQQFFGESYECRRFPPTLTGGFSIARNRYPLVKTPGDHHHEPEWPPACAEWAEAKIVGDSA